MGKSHNFGPLGFFFIQRKRASPDEMHLYAVCMDQNVKVGDVAHHRHELSMNRHRPQAAAASAAL
jgi:hypothetical protein